MKFERMFQFIKYLSFNFVLEIEQNFQTHKLSFYKETYKQNDMK
jgi:hypothetical protein